MKKFSMMVAALVLCSSAALAQDDRYTLTAGSAVVGGPGAIDIAVTLDSQAGTAGAAANIQGWSYGLCSDGAFGTVTNVVDGSLTATVNGGNEPDFDNINMAPAGGDGFTIGVIIDFFGVAVLAPGTGYELNVATYDVTATTGSMTLDFCNTLGAPAVETLVVEAGGVGVTPVGVSGLIEYMVGMTTYALDAGDVLALGTASVAVTMENSEAADGFSFGLTHDAAVATLDSIDQGSATAATNGGSGAAFFFANTTPALPMGATGGGFIGCVVSLSPPFDTIPMGVDQEVAVFNYTTIGAAGATTALSFSDQVGNPPVAVVVSVNGSTEAPTTDDGSIEVDNGVQLVEFVRGDANDDGTVDVTDVVFLAKWLFNVGPAGTCNDAGDVNDNGTLDSLDDPLALLSYLFQGGTAPASPFPACGTDSADCVSHSTCP